MLSINRIFNTLRGVYLDIYFYFNKSLLFKDKFGLSYYLYKNTRPKNTYNIGVRTDDTTVLYVIEKILSSSNNVNNNYIHCVDVGSYIGVVTLMMSKVLQKKSLRWQVHSFEPYHETFLRLKKNVDLDIANKNIVLNNIAVSDKSGVQTLKTYPTTPGQNHIDINSSENEDGVKKEKVNVITLHQYMNEKGIKHLKICKIDTEGTDELVVKGLNEYLNTKAIDYFIFEYQDNKSYQNIKSLLLSKGYKIYYMVRNENILVSSLENYPKNSKSLLNLIAVSEDKIIGFKKDFNLIN